jgi:acyl transferase domain-containing protein
VSTGEPTGPHPRDGQLSPIKRAFLAIDELTSKLEAAQRARTEPLAIVGIGCRFPGGARDPERFWALLRDGVDAVTPVPSDRWDVDAYYDPDPEAPGKIYTRSAALLDRVDLFDAPFFGIAPREAASMDPQQRLLLEVAWEALEHAGEAADRLSGSRTGVFIGICTNDYAHLQIKQQDPSRFDLYYGSGIAHSIAAGRLSYVLGLQGPSLAIDTACSSSLVALHLACQSLRSGECEMALVGGVNLILSPENTVTFCKSRMLAADGRSKTFDAAADGFVEGEGCGVVVLKRLGDALGSGNRILAVVRGTAVNQDGASSGLTAPNGPAQEAVIRQALAAGEIDPARVAYVEAHGTGTVLGDPIEVQALGAVFGPGRAAADPLMIGSVKTNIGHLEAAAGMAGLIKIVLALQHGEIPPHLHLQNPNPYVPWAELPIVVPTQRTPWPASGLPRLAGVSSFGFSGTNAHVVLEEAPAVPPVHPLPVERPLHLLTISAKSETALKLRAEDLQSHLARVPAEAIADVCYTANAGRAHLEHRLAVVTSSSTDLAQVLAAFAAGSPRPELATGYAHPAEPPRIAFLFTGQGSQYPGMARELYATEPRFRAALTRCAEVLGDRLRRPLLEVLHEEAGAALDETAYAQPALFAVEYALAEMWREWGVEPAFVLGHSLGEFAAACVAGVMRLEDALTLVAERGRLMQDLAQPGAMATLETEEAEVAAALAAETVAGGVVDIAAVNGPRNVVISGTEHAVGRVTAALAARGVPSQRLRGGQAFHSPLMQPVLAPLEAAAEKVTYGPARVGFISTLTGTVASTTDLGQPRYWRDQARGAVRFAQAMETLWERGVRLCLEIGPQPVLSSLGQQCVAEGVWISSLRRGREDWGQVLNALGRLYLAGVPINWSAVDGQPGRRRVTLPTYPFERRRHWIAPSSLPSRRSVGAPAETDRATHPLLGRRIRSSALKDNVFETRLDVDALSFLGDHRVLGQVVYPAAAYLASVAAAAREAFGDRGHRLEDVVLGERLVLGESDARVVQLILSPPEAGVSAFSLLSSVAAQRPDDDVTWQLHASGTIRLDATESAAAPCSTDEIRTRCADELDVDTHYRRLAARGIELGPAFRGVEQVWHRDGEALVRLRWPEGLRPDVEGHRCHPAMLDAGLQALAAALPAEGGPAASETYLPMRIGRFRAYGAMSRELWSHAVLHPATNGDTDVITGDVRVFDGAGQTVAVVLGIHMKRVPREALGRSGRERFRQWLYEVQWPAKPLAAPPVALGQSRPGPRDIAVRVGASWPGLRDRHGLGRYDELVAELHRLSGAYVAATLRTLGGRFVVGERFEPDVLATRLGVVEPHRRLFGRMLEMLEEDGVVVRHGPEYEVRREAEPKDLPRWHAALEARFPEYRAELALLGRCGPRLVEALRGERDPLELIFPSGALGTAEQLYEESPLACAYNTALQSVIATAVEGVPAHRRLRVLEIGAGTGGSTGFVLPALPADRTEYVFTDVSRIFTRKAAEKFHRYPFVRYRLLDIEESPASQGFAEERFDLVIAANVLHATRDLRRALGHVRELLAPDGLVALLEMGAPQRDVELVFGLTEGWWKFADHDLRPRHPLLPGSHWVALLSELGYRDPVAIPEAETTTGSANQVVLIAGRPANHADAAPVVADSGAWVLVADRGGLGRELAARLERAGEPCRLVSVMDVSGLDAANTDPMEGRLADVLAEDQGPWRGVVYLAGLDAVPGQDESPFTAQPHACGGLLHLVQRLIERRQAPPLWVVTRGAQALGTEGAVLAPAQAPLWGAAKVIAIEHPELRCVRIDLDPEAHDRARELELVVAELRGGDGEDQIAYRNGARHVARLARSAAAGTAATPASHPRERRAARLEISERGVLDNLELRPMTRRTPGPGEVEIEVHATGLNFKDVMGALGLYPGDPGPLGGECAGTVVALGTGVEALRIGDEVLALAPGAFSSYAVTRAEWVHRKPESWSFEQAATVLIPFATACYALAHLGRIRSGERVLIHAAAGGVGLAAVQVAQRAGAEIFATAGSPAKRAFVRSLGVRHVMSSRSTAFAAEIMAITEGRGVDLVLNSLAGDLAGASRSVLAPGGRFVEIGKTAVLDDEQRASFGKDRAYFVVDWGETAHQDPALIDGILRDLMDRLREGTLAPLPVRSFPLSRVVDAFRHMAQARHVGKIAVVHDAAGRSPSIDGAPPVRPDASYLITGGLRGLGLVVARHLVRRGARHLVLMGRTAPSDRALSVIEELRHAGVRVVVRQGDVSRHEDVAQAVAALTDMPPLRGVIHSAGVLNDGVLRRLDWPRFAEVLAPKVEGAWQLSRHTHDLPLDFFVLFSSVASLLGPAGQANHAAANAFLDTFAHRLRADGVPAVSINWGAWSEIGAAAERNVGERIGGRGVDTITPEDGVLVLEEVLGRGAAQVVVLPVRWPVFLRDYAPGAEPPFLSGVAREGRREVVVDSPAVAARDFRQELADTPLAERRSRLKAHVRRQVVRVLGFDASDALDGRRPLSELGLDSLMAVELRNLLSASVGLRRTLPATLLFDHPTIDALVDYLATELPGMPTTPEVAPVASRAFDASGDALNRIEELSDDEVDRVLKRTLRAHSG